MADSYTHQAARTDEEEAEALALAIALSLNDDVPPSALHGQRNPSAAAAPTSQHQPAPVAAASAPRPPNSAPAYAAPSAIPQRPPSQLQNPSPAGNGYPGRSTPQPPSHHGTRPGHATPQQTVPADPAHTNGSSSPQRARPAAAAAAAAAGAQIAGKVGGFFQQLLPSCAGCGGKLGLAPHVKALGADWHQQCFRCGGCGRAIEAGGGSFAIGQDKLPYHTHCHRELHHPRCYVCKGFIPSRGNGSIEWRENPFWKMPHCPAHSSDGTPQCCSCNRLQVTGEEGVTLSDGRLLCLDCVDTVVVDTADCQPLYDEVLAFYRYMGMPLPYKAPMLLVEGPVLNEYSAREGVGRGAGPVFHVRGLTLAEVYRSISSVVADPGSGRGSRGGMLGSISSVPFSLTGALSSLSGRSSPAAITERCSVTCILVLYGLPRLLIGSILAHELLHAYLRMRHVTGLDDQIEEGLAQLMAMLWLDGQEHEQISPFSKRLASYLGYQIRTDPSPTYGDGFRIAHEKFQQRGLKALVEHVIATHAWPDWHA